MQLGCCHLVCFIPGTLTISVAVCSYKVWIHEIMRWCTGFVSNNWQHKLNIHKSGWIKSKFTLEALDSCNQPPFDFVSALLMKLNHISREKNKTHTSEELPLIFSCSLCCKYVDAADGLTELLTVRTHTEANTIRNQLPDALQSAELHVSPLNLPLRDGSVLNRLTLIYFTTLFDKLAVKSFSYWINNDANNLM